MSGDGWGTSFIGIQSSFSAGDTLTLGNIANIKNISTRYDPTSLSKKEHNNKVPTHDPYTNPNAHIYFSCNCGAILDPGTKSFAALTTYAGKVGWKIRFTDQGYIPYCVDCGKDVD